jgi:Flp pilus assembly secretin CpaC
MTDKSCWAKVLALGLLVTGGTSFLLAQSSADEILLKVRFALVDSGAESVLESKLSSFDRGGQALNVRTLRPDLNLDFVLAGLQSPEGGLRMLAEQKVLTSNAKTVTLLAGDKFPIPVLSDGAISVVSQEFGIRLAFQAAIERNGNIHLSANPEVRTIDGARNTQMNGFIIPALETRRVDADIELSEGQSFVISGLIDDHALETMPKIPGLLERDPILSEIFKSGNKGNGKLVVIVTAETLVPKLAQNDQRAAVVRMVDSGS